jgi:xanthine dehydrogenase accessory factor
MDIWPTIAQALERHGRCAMVTVAAVEGSAPREPGARMILLPGGGFHGTIGGGTLEWRALAEAQAALERGAAGARLIRQALGPELGQCCGGQVTLLLEVFDSAAVTQARAFAALEQAGGFRSRGRLADGQVRREVQETGAPPAPMAQLSATGVLLESFGESRRPILLFGAGHVGRALVLALAPLPVQVAWIDPRPNAFPAAVPANVKTVAVASPVAALAAAPTDAFALVMTHSHALDLDIVHGALSGDLPYVGLIGSATKRARFVKRLRDLGLSESRIAALVCPIGVPGIGSKAPAVIAAAMAAEILIRDESLRAAASSAAIQDRAAS